MTPKPDRKARVSHKHICMDCGKDWDCTANGCEKHKEWRCDSCVDSMLHPKAKTPQEFWHGWKVREG